jgi:hypothetical protein
MNRFQDLWSKLLKGIEAWPDYDFENAWCEFSEGLEGSSDPQASQPSPSEAQDDTTVRAASTISEALFDHKLTQSEKKIAGPAVHYSLGTSVGGLYGVAAETAPEVTAGKGLPFGAAFWLVVDEGAVPFLGFSKGQRHTRSQPTFTHSHHILFMG